MRAGRGRRGAAGTVLTGDTRPRVFFSYRRSDTQHVAGRVADKLADRYELFMDIDTIPPGVDFSDYLKRAVGGCDVLLAFIGGGWLGATDEGGGRRLDDPADWVAAEVETALSRGVPVIPVLVDGATLPTAEALPERLRALAGRQATPLRFESFTADLTHLVAAIDHAARLGPPASAAAGSGSAEPAFADHWDQQPERVERTPAALAVPASRRKAAPLAVGVLVAALIGGGAWFLLGHREPGAAPAPTLTTVATSSRSGTQPAASAPPTIPAAASVTELKQRVPESFRATCRKLVPDDRALAADLVVAVQCSPASGGASGPRYAFYLQYPTAEAARNAFREYYASGPPGAGDCTQAAGEVADDRSPGSSSGVLRCYQDANGFTVFAWLSPEQAIVASVADPDRTFGELLAWWNGAGPVGQ